MQLPPKRGRKPVQRDCFTNLFSFKVMVIKAIFSGWQVSSDGVSAQMALYDNTNQVTEIYSALLELGVELIHGVTTIQVLAAIKTKVQTYATLNSNTLADNDIYWPDLNPTELASFVSASQVRSFNNAPSAAIVTGTGATGAQVSASRDAHVSYSPTMVTTASISGNASDVIVLEICPTNSATAGNWIEIARVTNAQALTLAITLQSVQTTSGVLNGIVPAGYYRKVRAITSGTVSNSMSSGQEVLL